MSSSALYSPPRPPVRTRELGWYQLLKTLRGNALEMWPERAYEQEILVNRFFGRQRVLLNAPEAVHHVLVENAANYRRSPASIRILRPLVGRGLFLSEGEEWKHQRRTIAPALAPRVMPLLARHVVLAAGSVPRTLPGLPVDGRWVMTSDEFLDLKEIPASVAVVGGGAIGCEFASLLSDLGAKVTVLEALDSILTGCDDDIVRLIARSFKKRGIEIVTGVQAEGHTPSEGGSVTAVRAGDQTYDVEAIVVSVGRRPRTENLVAEGVAVTLDDGGFVVADEYQRTGEPGVWAVGDVVSGTPQLAHVGFAEAIVAVKGMLGEPVLPVDYAKVPWAIYCHPEVAFCGMTEAQAKAAGIPVVTKKDPFGGNSRALIVGDTEGVVKVVAEQLPDGSAGRILGVHMAGPWVTEQLGAGYLAVNWEAYPEEVANFIQPHPSLSEAFGETMMALTGRGLHVG